MDIEEIKRLNAERTAGNWEPDSKIGVCLANKYNRLQICWCGVEAEGSSGDAAFIAAAPAIAQRCIELDVENKELRKLLKESLWQINRMNNILRINNLNGGLYPDDGPIKRIEDALKKAGVL